MICDKIAKKDEKKVIKNLSVKKIVILLHPEIMIQATPA